MRARMIVIALSVSPIDENFYVLTVSVYSRVILFKSWPVKMLMGWVLGTLMGGMIQIPTLARLMNMQRNPPKGDWLGFFCLGPVYTIHVVTIASTMDIQW